MSQVQFVKVKDTDDGIRLNRWFLKYYPDLPLSRLQKLLRTKQVKVDGKKCETATRLISGQEIRVPPLQDDIMTDNKTSVSKRDAEFVRSLVIYKDENIIVLNKPSGLAVQGGTNTKRHIDGMLSALCFENDEAPKLVHRIDKDTSGILLLARNRKYAELLTKAFKNKEIKKTYLAVVQGCPKQKKMIIDAPLLKQGERMVVAADGQKALSEMRVLDNAGDRFALVELSPQTGRTHQLRAHMKYIGNPIVGDDRYFIERKAKINDIADKLYLHAYKIDLTDIYKKLVITAEIPEYFKQVFDSFGWRLK